MNVALQISPEAKSAFFKDYLAIAEHELTAAVGRHEISLKQIGNLDFFELDVAETQLQALTELSFVQGIYQREKESLTPLPVKPDWYLHDDFIFGSKFKGKTNEHLTQMLLNVGLSSLSETDRSKVKLLDPMAGRGTTLLWAMRYGINAWGIEQDAKALDDVRQILRKWSKLHRQKHKLSDGFIGKPNRKNDGKFIDYAIESSHLRLVCGDARQADQLYRKEKFDLIISDLPYGVQHFTTDNTRNPLQVIADSVVSWADRLKKSGAVVLAFNSYQPKRDALIAVFEQQGFVCQSFQAAHRMSESIVRDVVVFTKP